MITPDHIDRAVTKAFEKVCGDKFDPRPEPSYPMKEIGERVAAKHGMTLERLRGTGRRIPEFKARAEAMSEIYAYRTPTGDKRYSLAQIGQFFFRDHTSVLNAIRRHEGGG